MERNEKRKKIYQFFHSLITIKTMCIFILDLSGFSCKTSVFAFLFSYSSPSALITEIFSIQQCEATVINFLLHKLLWLNSLNLPQEGIFSSLWILFCTLCDFAVMFLCCMNSHCYSLCFCWSYHAIRRNENHFPVLTQLYFSSPWRLPRWGWIKPWATRSSCGCLCSTNGSWIRWSSDGPSNSMDSMIPWFYFCFQKHLKMF